MGAPWLSGIADIRSLVRDVGLTLVDNYRTAQLFTIYRRRQIASPIFDFYSVCTMGQ
jgi:hypothetical protein